jgi:hypothetical protein
MKIVKIVRDFANIGPYRMFKEMGKKTLQAYLTLERKSKRISAEDLAALKRITVAHGGTASKFYQLLDSSLTEDRN